MFHALAMFHMSANVPCFVGCSTHRLVSHGDAPSRGRHCLRGLRDPSDPNSLSNPGSPDPSKLGGRRDFSSNSNLSLSNPNNPNNPNNPSNPNSLSFSSNRGPNPSNPSNPSNRNNPSNLSRRNNPSSPNSLSNQ